MQRIKAMLKTTAVRLSLLYLVLFVVSATALLFYVTSVAEGLLRAQTERAIERELQSVNTAYRSGGLNNVMRYIERRSRQPGANLFIIASPSGEIFAGNVASIAPGVFDEEGRIEEPFAYTKFGDINSETNYTALAHVMHLPNGLKLLIGRDLAEPGRFQSLIRDAVQNALIFMGLGALAIWFFIGRTALKRIDRMSQASEKIMAGDMTQRLPVTGSGDEFDRLSVSLNTMLGRIERLNEGLRQVSDNIAHDLKTPLTRLRNRAEAALATKASTDDYRDALEDMISESDQLIRIFSALLMISRVEAGSAAAKITKTDLSSAAKDAAELYEALAEEANVALTADIAMGLEINGNRELIGQALSNLIDNAVKYARMENGVKSDVKANMNAKAKADATISIRLEKTGDEALLTVADNGVGIPQDKHGEVVKRFVRLDKSRNLPGTGLGLSMVDAVMRLHNGQLELGATNAESDDYPGLSVTMRFPLM